MSFFEIAVLVLLIIRVQARFCGGDDCRDRKDGTEGLAFSQEGLMKPESKAKFALLQTIRRRDSVCQ